MNIIESLKLYHHRQVVINVFEYEELVDRTGFYFDTLHIEQSQMLFLKGDVLVYSLHIPFNGVLTPSTSFKNHFILTNGTDANRVEIYFP